MPQAGDRCSRQKQNPSSTNRPLQTQPAEFMLRSDRSAHRTITFHPTCITYPRNHNSGSGMRLLLTFSLAVDPTMALTVHASRGYIQPFACIWLAGSFTEAFRPYVMPSWASPDMPGNYICFHWMIMKAVMLKPPPSCNFSTHWDVQPAVPKLSCKTWRVIELLLRRADRTEIARKTKSVQKSCLRTLGAKHFYLRE